MYYTYILYSQARDRFYSGASEDPKERLRKHNNKSKGFTNQANDWTIVYLKAFDSKREALDHEKQIKNWKSRKKIQQLIERSAGSERPDV